MKIKYHFEPVDMGSEYVAVAVGDGAKQVKGLLKLNQEGLEILNMLENQITEEQIVQRLLGKYENAPESIKKYVSEVIKTLREAKLIDE